MPVIEIPHATLGLLSVGDAAALRGVNVRTVQRWVSDGLIPAVVSGAGKRVAYLLRRADVEQFRPRSVGAPKRQKSE